MNSDPIADMLTRLRNAGRAGHPTAEVPHSRLKGELARVLKREGFIRDYTTEPQGARRVLKLHLKYAAGEPVIQGLRRISTPGCRRYVRADRLPRVRSGIGMAILTTSAGLMTEREARRRKVGGEVICHIW